CANLSSGGPLCLAVDDAHWADAPSLRYLAFLLPRLEELPVALVVATRPPDAHVGSDLLEAITANSSAEVVRIPPLSPAGVRGCVEGPSGAPPAPEFVDACLRATGGTPFLLRELVVALRAERVRPTAESAGHVDRVGADRIGRSIALRLGQLPEPAVRL